MVLGVLALIWRQGVCYTNSMDKVADSVAQAVRRHFEGYELPASFISRPDPKFGDYSTNIALILAKPLGMSPRQIAETLAEELRHEAGFEAVTVEGPGFINIKTTAAYLATTLRESWNDNYGQADDGVGKTVVVEFPSPNVAKPYSVGHLRPGNQGWAVKRLMEATGWKVITDNHLGDYGSPFGVWVAGFKRFSSDKALKKSGVYELGRIYIVTKKALKDEAEAGGSELADEVQSWLLKLEKGDKEALKYSQRFKDISLEHIHGVMNRLKISTDYELGEASYVTRGKQAVKDLLDQGIATQNDDGSVIVPLDDQGIDTPLLVQKSNGAALYATTDLATLLYRDETWHPDRVIYCVGAEQQFYFKQLFALAKKLGLKTELVHLWFGTIDQKNDDGSREKMSSRKGVVLMEELLDKAEARAKALTEDRAVDEDDIRRIALGAIKFSDFVADRRTSILFDWDSIFALSGFSGPYIQYAAVRVNKILEAADKPKAASEDYDYEAERAVIGKLLEYPSLVKLAARDLEPHKVAAYLYELARELNRYYEATRIIGSPDHELVARLDLLDKVAYVFKHGLDLLGIEVPSQM